MRTGRPKGSLTKPKWETWIIPEGVTPVFPLPDTFTKETELEFNDSTYGLFKATFRSFQRSKGLSTHPKAIEQRRLQTNLERYGVSNAGATKQAREKASNTMLKKYGVKNALESEVFLNKSKETLKKNYNVENPMHSEVIKKSHIEAVFDKYGVDNVAKSEEVKSKLRKRMIELGLAKPLPNGKTAQQMFDLLQTKFISNVFTLRKKFGEEFALDWLEKRKDKVSSLELLSKKYFDYLEPFQEVPKELKGKGYRPDFKFKDVFVDVDGLLYHSEKYKDKQFHLRKAKEYKDAGLKLLQFYQDEIVDKTEIVDSIIRCKTGIIDRKLFARKLEIRNVPQVDAAIFLETNHLMGNYVGSSYIGLYDKDELVCIFGYRSLGPGIDCTRFCSKLNTMVVGGLSKLLKYIITTEKPLFVQSYVDYRYGDGESLIKLGFELANIHLGWRWTDGYKTYNRLHCRANMDSRGLSELEHAKELKLYKIYDAGQAKYILKL